MIEILLGVIVLILGFTAWMISGIWRLVLGQTRIQTEFLKELKKVRP